jgi:hypothetical protein
MRVIAWITAPDLPSVLRKIKVRGIFETAHRAKQRCGQVFHYAIAIATGRAVHDITADLRGALAPMVTTNHAAITDRARAGNCSAPSLASRLDRIAARPRGAWVVENSCIGIGATAAAAIPSSCNTSSLSISEFPIPAGLWWAGEAPIETLV